jgi:hypothetical protein
MHSNKLIRNEQIIRNRNRTVSQALKKYFGGDKGITDAPLEFICECSDIKCQEPITVTITEYEKLHKRNDRFLIIKGHKSPSVEKTVEVRGKLELVEKPDLAA